MKKLAAKMVFYGNRAIYHPFFIAGLLLALFVYFAIGNAHFQQDNRDILNGIAGVQQRQEQTLQAIKEVAIDARLTAEQQTKIIICMLKVPINQRTTDLENNCRKQVAKSILLESSTSNSSSNQTSTGSRSKSTKKPNSNPGSPEKPTCAINVLMLHLGCGN